MTDEEAFEYWWAKIQEGRMPHSKYLAARFWKEALRWERLQCYEAKKDWRRDG
jgi:hypothetical protein